MAKREKKEKKEKKSKKRGGDISKSLKKYEKAWGNAEAHVSGKIPDNDYVVNISAMEVGFSKSGRLQVVTSFSVASGKLKGKDFKKFSGLDTEEGMAYFKGMCEVLGIDIPENISDLPDALNEFVDNNKEKLNVGVKTKDDFQNVYIKGFVDGDADDDEDAEDEDDEDEDEEEEDEDDEDEEEEEDDEDEDDEDDKKSKRRSKKKDKKAKDKKGKKK